MKKQAIAILKKHQAAMQDRFCSVVISLEETLALEAVGEDSYTNEMYELAEKLRGLAVAISLLPEDQPEPSPEPVSIASVVMVTSSPQMTMGDFLANYQVGSLEGSATALSHVLGISFQRAVGCVNHFHKRWTSDPDTLAKVMSLPQELHTSNNGTILLLHELFGLSGMEAITAINILRS